KNDFSMQDGFLKGFIEAMDGILILIMCGFSLITVFFDIKPLDTMVRQRIKKIDRDAQVVSEIVELGKEKKEVIYKFNLILGSLMLVMAVIVFFYVALIGNDALVIEDKFFATQNMKEIALVVFALLGIVLSINGFKRIYLEIESRKIKI
ncbi:MAG: hypothetical protein ACTSRD_03980, partial [Promethearchaeota archaeon]